MDTADISIEEIDRRIRATGFSGVVSFALPGGASPSGLRFGYADRGHRVPNSAQTRFAMASGSKAFTAVAVGMLIQEGCIALGTRIAECIGSRQFHFGADVTIGKLLNHTLGMSFLYSNAGYILLGLVVEESTGRDFRDIVAERILLPCGMTRTGYFPMGALPDNTTLGYLEQDERDRYTNIFSLPSIGGPDGGAFTTAGDLRLFWTSLLTGHLLEPELLALFLSPSVKVPERDDGWYYDYGFWLKQRPATWIASIEGRDPGASMISRVRLSDGRITTVLSNHQDGAWVVNRLLEESIDAC